jgi:cell division protein FtsN
MKSISLAAAAALTLTAGAAMAQAQPARPATPAQPTTAPAEPATAAQPAHDPAEHARMVAEAQAKQKQEAAEKRASEQAAADAQLTPELRQAQTELLRVIGELQAGNVNYDKFHPKLAAAIRPAQPGMTPGLAKLGKVEAVRHKGKDPHGRDHFEVTFGTDATKATTNWFIGFDDAGKINGFEFR